MMGLSPHQTIHFDLPAPHDSEDMFADSYFADVRVPVVLICWLLLVPTSENLGYCCVSFYWKRKVFNTLFCFSDRIVAW